MLRSAFTALCVLLSLLLLSATAFGRGGGGCLAAGTGVLTPAGTVPIESLAPGQAVYSVREGRLCNAVVTGVSQVSPVEFVDITLDGDEIEATPEHPFEVAPDTFVAAARLHVGDHLFQWNGNQAVDTPIRAIHRIGADRPAYNLTVMPGETFLANGIVVHNKGCFLPDTPVLQPGGSSIAIARLHASDRVLAFDDDRKVVLATVLEVVSIEVDGYLRIATDRVTLSVTDEHPFLVGEQTFKLAEALRPGDTVFAFDGAGLTPQIIRSITPVPGRVRVYNLRTSDPHTYFAAGIAVHNKGGGGGGGGHGGGGHFGGGGWGGHSSGSGSSSNSVFDTCFCFAIALFFVGVIAIANWQKVKDRQAGGVELDYVHRSSDVRPKSVATEAAMTQLARTDPSFDPKMLRNYVRDVFTKLQTCWQSQNYAPMQPLLTPGLYEQHRAQLAAMKSHNEINRIENLQIDSIDFVHVHYNPADNRPDFTALITARAKDYYVDARTQKFLRGDTSTAQFQEFWTFGHNDRGWVLRRIEQSMESTMLTQPNSIGQGSASGPAGPWTGVDTATQSTEVNRLLAEWSKSDPTWDRGQLIDRVSALFTAVSLSMNGTSPVPMEAVTAEFADQLAREAGEAQKQNTRTELRNFDVRHVDLVIARRFADAAQDLFIARVAAHCQTIVTRGGAVIRKDPDVRPWVRFCQFAREQGVWKMQAILTPQQAEDEISAGNVDEYSA